MGLDVLTEEAARTFRIAERILNAVKDGSTAQSVLNDLNMANKVFGNDAGKILTNPAFRALGDYNKKTLMRAIQAAGSEAVEAATAAGVPAAEIVAASLGLIYLVAGVLLVTAAVVGGAYMAYNWNRPTSEPVTATTIGDPRARAWDCSQNLAYPRPVAAGADGNAICDNYARYSLAQTSEMLRKNCGYSGPVWTCDYKGAYDFCMRGIVGLGVTATLEVLKFENEEHRAKGLKACADRKH